MRLAVRRGFAAALLLCFTWSGTAVAFNRCCGASTAPNSEPAAHAGHQTGQPGTDDTGGVHDCNCLAGCCVATVDASIATAAAATLVNSEPTEARLFRSEAPLLAIQRFLIPFPLGPPLA